MNISIKEVDSIISATVGISEKQKNEEYQRIYSADVVEEVRKTFPKDEILLLSGPQYLDNKFGAISAEWIFEKKVETPKPAKPRRQARKKTQKIVDNS